MPTTSDSMKRLKELAGRSDLKAFEEAWAEAVAGATGRVRDFLDVITVLESQGHFQKAAGYLGILLPNYLDHGKNEEALLVLKRMAAISPRASGLRSGLLKVFRAKYANDAVLETLLKLSGLSDSGSDIVKSVQQLETYLAFTLGSYVEHRAGWGVGVVTAVDPEAGTVTVDFREMKGHQLTFDVAHSITKPLPIDHLRAMKFDRMNELRRLAEEDEVRLVKIAVLSRERASTVRDVRDMLTDGVISAKDWSKWWTKARTKVKRDNNIKLGTGNNPAIEVTARENTFEDQAVANMAKLPDLASKVRFLRDLLGELESHPLTQPAIMMGAGVLAKTTTEGVHANPGAAISLALILEKVAKIDNGYTIPDHLRLDSLLDDPYRVVSVLPAVPIAADRKEVLQRLKERFPEQWPDVCEKGIWLGENDVGDFCLKELVAMGAFDRAIKLIFELLKRFRDNREAFMWYVRVAIGDKLHPALPNPGKVSLLEKTLLLHSFVRNKFFQTEDPDLRREFRSMEKMLQNRNYEFVRETLGTCAMAEAVNFYTMVRTSRNLPDDVKDGMIAAILRTRPEVAKERAMAEEGNGDEHIVDERVIYVTRAGYLRYETDFNKLVNDDIPNNAREIGRAASFGDLSENAEWTAALEKQGLLTRRAEEMRAALEKARIIDDSIASDGTTVAVGCTITLLNLQTQKTETYTLLGPWDADMERGIISYLAPLGRALLSKKVGSETHIELPSGRVAYRLEAIVPMAVTPTEQPSSGA
jgi:transcription elongation factor GreA